MARSDSEARLTMRAFREEWPMTDEARRVGFRVMLDILDDETEIGKAASTREKIMAKRVVLMARAQDRAAEIAWANLELRARKLDHQIGQAPDAVTIDVIERAAQIRRDRAARLALPAPEAPPSCV